MTFIFAPPEPYFETPAWMHEMPGLWGWMMDECEKRAPEGFVVRRNGEAICGWMPA